MRPSQMIAAAWLAGETPATKKRSINPTIPLLCMVDTLTTTERSEMMSRIKGKNTKPEMIVRRLAHGMGYRYRLHRKGLPGRPDLIFSSRKKIIFVHGCFWHHHSDPNCKIARMPKSRLDYWQPKLKANVARDELNEKNLLNQGWEVLTIWECDLKDLATLKLKLDAFLQWPKSGKAS